MLEPKKRGRKPPQYGPPRCTGCYRPPRYRDGVLVACECGAPANARAPRSLKYGGA
jgi:hypothetical protein